MAGKLWLVAVVLALSISISSVLAVDINVTPLCGQCLAGSEAVWNVTISNQGQTELGVERVELMDTGSFMVFAQYNSSMTVFAKRPVTVQIDGFLPEYSGVPNLSYRVCYLLSVLPSQRTIEDISVGTTRYFCNPYNLSMPLLQCIDSFGCSDDESCVKGVCVKLACEGCSYIGNHSCLKYECCSGDGCGASEACVSNSCVSLECLGSEQVFNHSCVPLECAADEAAVNGSCVALGCGKDEGFFNHSCVKLGCRFDQFVFNHSCVDLSCAGDEGFRNNSCFRLQCSLNETVSNHSCILKKCGFFSKLDGHGSCVFNRDLAYLSFEPFLVVGLGLAVVLVWRRVSGRSGLRLEKAGKPVKSLSPVKEASKGSSVKDSGADEAPLGDGDKSVAVVGEKPSGKEAEVGSVGGGK
ncbi:hypothetical protein HY640_01550 [Candidatus Woesearchaeota archaeon]|nr:hypothetical protein [Candidatus Woesearchaeota archaeon]